jgi:4-hydroxyproline epimerase
MGRAPVQVVDSHTGGEPTRIVIDGGPQLGVGTMAELRERFARDHDSFRSAVVNEPRGSEVWIGGLLCQPVNPQACAGVVFFNNVGVLNMCGHGTIGLAVTLAHLGRIQPGEHILETPVGDVRIRLHDANRVTVINVPSYRYRAAVPVDVPGYGQFVGDIAWGGNWFYLVEDHDEQLELANSERLTEVSWAIRMALEEQGITGADDGLIDHIDLFAAAQGTADSRNFVLCPGKAFDRSPCGTGTSAKLACLLAEGTLAAGQVWRQESIVGSVFEGVAMMEEGQLVPHVTGTAYVNAEATLMFHDDDPFAMGIRP